MQISRRGSRFSERDSPHASKMECGRFESEDSQALECLMATRVGPPCEGSEKTLQRKPRGKMSHIKSKHDEAHFWLNGYVNKQNCRIWSEANPQVYVETPLHPEKLTVWCALWAGGILLQKR
ncbi:hypothetical protein TNCV_2889941 [Trichonephila clavipes]|nr:hypothetical protein TNCV_2889941 [Trichonephila clavipes]